MDALSRLLKIPRSRPSGRFTAVAFGLALLIAAVLGAWWAMVEFDWQACMSFVKPRPSRLALLIAATSAQPLWPIVFMLFSLPCLVVIGISDTREAKILALAIMALPLLAVSDPAAMHQCDRHGIDSTVWFFYILVIPLSILLLFGTIGTRLRRLMTSRRRPT